MKAEMVIVVVAIVLLGIPTVPSAAQGDNSGSPPPPSCLASISSGCNITDTQNTDAQLLVCCTALTSAISKDLDCFCLIKPYLNLDDPSSADAIESLFTYCKINGTFDTLCPGSNSSPDQTTASTTSPSDTTSSPIGTSTPSTPGSSSSTTGGTRLPSARGIRRNAGSKIATKFLPSLFIVLICLVIS